MDKEPSPSRHPLAVVVVAVFLAGLSAGIVLVTQPQITHAGSNGQVLDIVCNGASQVSVVGTNQNGDSVQQTLLYPAPTTDGQMHFFTYNYWYTGFAAITWTDSNGTPHVYHAKVPMSQASNYYVSDCHNHPDSGPSVYDCDPVLRGSQDIATCLAFAPTPSGCVDCQPYLASVVLQSQGFLAECVLESGINDVNGYPIPGNPAGLANISTRFYGFSYRSSNPYFSGQAEYSSGPGPLYIIGSSMMSYSCLA